MRKHFLLLFLLTLLPLAGWAQTATFGEMSLGNYTYGDLTLPVPQVKDSEGAILNTNDHYTVVEGAFTDEACTQKVTNLKDLKADETKYYRKVQGKGTYVGQSKTAWFTVTKKTLNITVTTDFKRGYNTTADPTIGTDWDGEGFVNTSGQTGGWTDTKDVLTGTLQYNYAGKGNRTCPGGVYPITFSGLSSDKYDIKYPTMNFTIVGTNLSSANVTVKQGTDFADKTYKGDFYTAADLTGLRLVWNNTELVQGTDFDVVLKAVYSFTSYPSQTASTTYGTGKVNVLSKDATDAIVVVTENSVNGFEGKKYKVALTAKNGTRTQLFGDGTGNDYTTPSGIWVEVTRSTTDGEIAMNVGEYNYDVVFKGNYSGKKTSFKKVKIVEAPITVSLKKAVEKTYSNKDYKDVDLFSDASLDFSGICGEDMANAATIKQAFLTASTNANAFTVKCLTTAVEAADNYVLTIAGGAVGSYTNYVIKNYLPGTLKIKKAKLALKAKDAKRGIDDANPTFELDPAYYTAPATNATAPAGYVDPIVDGDKIVDVTFTCEAGQVAGKYDITPVATNAKVQRTIDNKTTDVTKNYEFVIVENNTTAGTTKGQLTVGKSAIYVNIQNADKFYGQADPEFTAVITGLTGGDEIPATAYTITRTAGEAPGFYEMTTEVANPNPEKYTSITVVPGIFEIKKAKLTFTIPAQNVVTGNTASALKKDNIKVEGIYKSDDVAANMYELAFNVGATGSAATNPGTLALDANNKIQSGNDTYAKGIIATLKDAYKANYEVVGANKVDPQAPATESVAATGKLIVNDGYQVTLSFTSVNNDFTTIKNHAGEKQAVTIKFAPRNGRTLGVKRNWKAGEWATMVLPFDISVADLSKALGYAIVNVINPEKTVISGTGSTFYGKLTMTGGNGYHAGKADANTKLAANKPFLIKLADDLSASNVYNFGNQTIVAPDDLSVNADNAGSVKFTGTYTTKTVTKADEQAIWFMTGNPVGDDKTWLYILSTSAATWNIVPFEAYIDMSSLSNEARNMTFYVEELDGSVTAINGITKEVIGTKLNVDGWYTLNGVKLQSAPTEKGIYINNGKKIVIK